MVNDARAFSPKLQGNRRQMLCRLFHNKLSDRDTSRKENIVKPLFQQLLVFLPAALDHRNIAFRGSILLQSLQ